MRNETGVRSYPHSTNLDDYSDVLTIEEAACVLRISRGAAYELTRQWRETAGGHGLPVVVLGGTLRVPKAALRRLLDVWPLGPFAGD